MSAGQYACATAGVRDHPFLSEAYTGVLKAASCHARMISLDYQFLMSQPLVGLEHSSQFRPTQLPPKVCYLFVT
jgi:hypothetical protein